MSLTRRQFLVRTGVVSGGLVAVSGCSLVPVLPTFATPEQEDALAWVQITESGDVLFYCPRAEMGQGIASSFTRVVSAELGVPQASVVSRYPDTSQIAPTKMTVGSESVEAFVVPLATAAATLREALRARAAAQLGTNVSNVTLASGAFEYNGESVAFSTLVDGQSMSVVESASPPPELLSMKPAALAPDNTYALDIVTGREVYSRDAWDEDMLFGAVARPSWLGAKRVACNRAAAMAVKGVVKVVDGPDGEIGVVAETPMAARQGIAALACVWETLGEAQRAAIDAVNDVDELIDGEGFEHTPVDEGNIREAATNALHDINVRYDSPMAAHASMEPRAGMAKFADGRCYVATGSQDPWYVQGAVARAVDLPREKVVAQNHRMGGGFGGRIHCQASVEAAWLSKGAGKPVKVQWSREDEFNRNYAGPAFSHRIRAGVNEDGVISHWHHQMVGSPILTTSALIPSHLHWAVDLAPDPGTWRGAETSYQIANHRVDYSDIRRPMATGAWRGLGAAPNTYAVECAMDELAQAADIDPIDFRIKNAASPRLGATLKKLRDMVPVNSGHHIGVAAGAYKGVTFVAVAAEVSDAGELTGLWCTHDCGRMINPDRVKAQVEGCLVWGIGMALSEAFVVENGIGVTDNFHRYQVPRINDVPLMEIHLMASEETSSGAGEAAFPPATAAIVNAFARANGRQRVLPLS